jgi:hypothetical protein
VPEIENERQGRRFLFLNARLEGDAQNLYNDLKELYNTVPELIVEAKSRKQSQFTETKNSTEYLQPHTRKYRRGLEDITQPLENEIIVPLQNAFGRGGTQTTKIKFDDYLEAVEVVRYNALRCFHRLSAE